MKIILDGLLSMVWNRWLVVSGGNLLKLVWVVVLWLFSMCSW